MRTYGKIWYKHHGTNGTWVLELEPHVSIRFKDIFRKANKGEVGKLSISDSDATQKDLAWFMERYPLEISVDDLRQIHEGCAAFDKHQTDVENLFVPGIRFASYGLELQPRDYQKLAVEVLLKNKALLCADDVGLGKTVVGIGGIVKAGEYPAMVVCQTHLPAQWTEQFQKFAPGIRVHTIKTRRAYSLPEADVYLMPYSRLIGWDDVISKGVFKTVVYDECQELRRSESEKYRTAMILSKKANRVLALSATPIYNYGAEMYCVMNIIQDGCLGTWDEFLREWCVRDYWGPKEKSKVRNPKALGTHLRESYLMLRRTRKDVSRELPAVNKVVHHVEYDEDVAEKAQVELETIAARVVSGTFMERGQAARELDSRARMMTGVAKAVGVANYVKILLENEEKVLLVGWHRDVYDRWNTELAVYHPVMYTGSESPNQKEQAKRDFLSGKTNLMIMSLRSGVGLDGLQEVCSLVVFGELDWSPGVHEQVTGRVQRDGQNSKVTALYLVTDNGTDPLMIDVLGLKSSQAHGMINPHSDVEFVESDDARIKKLAANILARKK